MDRISGGARLCCAPPEGPAAVSPSGESPAGWVVGAGFRRWGPITPPYSNRAEVGRVQRIDGGIVLSPSDLPRHQECHHLTALNLEVADGRLAPPAEGPSDQTLLVADLGIAHELRYLESLEAEGRSVVRLSGRAGGAARAEREVLEAMRAGVDVIYQATLFDGTWGGLADFLLKTSAPAEHLGDWSYEVADAKLARRVKVPALLQMATYADRLAVLQGREPERVCVVTGDGVLRPFKLVDVAAYTRRARRKLETFVAAVPPTGPVPIGYCDQCTWSARCADELRTNDDLSLVAGMRRDQRAALIAVGVPTLERLADADPDTLKATGIGRATRERLQDQAREQLRGRAAQAPTRTLLQPAPAQGLLRLPEPSPGDLYLDFEGDPLSGDGLGLEYLAGLGDREGTFTALWAHDHDQERRMVGDLIDRIVDAWRADPGMHVYHYAAYEVSALKRLTGRYGAREAELDQLLRAERFVDLYPVVRQSMRISKESYSIKKVEAFYGREHTGDVADAMSSVVEYEQWLADRDPARLQAIEDYQRDDVDSTRELHDLLETQRAELEAGAGPLPPATCTTGWSPSPPNWRPGTARCPARRRPRSTPIAPGPTPSSMSWRWSGGCRPPASRCWAIWCSGTAARPGPPGGSSSTAATWRTSSSSRTAPRSAGSRRRSRSVRRSAASCTGGRSLPRTPSC